MTTSIKCARCMKAPADHEPIVCPSCGRSYAVCGPCGGEAAAKRSLKSHNGLYHPAGTMTREEAKELGQRMRSQKEDERAKRGSR